jgi:DNA-binding protein HU-beta
VNKQDIINAVAKATGQTKAAAADSVDAFCNTIKQAVSKGNEVRLIGFGTFTTKKVPAKTVRNPRNGQQIKVAARTAVRFRPGKDLKDAANG